MSDMIKNIILQKDVNEITKAFIEDMFAAYHDRETNTFKQANYDMTTDIKLSNNEYKWVKGTITTTLGRLIFNRFVLEKTGIIEFTGFWNEELSSRGLSKLNNVIGNFVMTDVITTMMMGEYVDNRDKLGFWCAAFASSSISPSLLRQMPDVNKKKAELFKQYEKELKSDNPVEQIMTVNNIENELMDIVRENLKNDSGYDLYASGVGNLNNNYKTINVMRGAVFNNITKKYDVVENSLMNGVTKKDIPAFANSITAAAYPSAIGTAEAGAIAKIILALLQSEHINPDAKSYCGTKMTIPVVMSKQNKQHMYFRYINDNGKRVLLTPNNVDNYVGEMVNLYSPMCCTHDAICGVCAGTLFHNLGVTQTGLLTTQITQKMLNIKLKSKHDLSQSAGIVDEKYLFLDKNDYCTIEKGIMKNNVTMRLFIPRLLEELNGFFREATAITCMGIFPVKFYDKNNNVLLSTMLTVPVMLTFNVYNDIQEDVDNYIVSYEPGSDICNLGFQKVISNVECFINQIYLNSKSPQIPYNLMTEMMSRCLDMNGIDLTGPMITYEMLGRRVCRHGNDPFAKVYGKGNNVGELSYVKLPYRTAVQTAGVLQGILFQDTAVSINKGLAASLNGIEPVETPLEKIIKS